MEWLQKIFATRQIRGLKILLASILTIAEMLGLVLFDTAVTPRGQKLDLDGYVLVLEDNFDGASLDLSKWEYRASGARRAGFNSPGQVFLRDGNLVIKAEYKADGEYGAGWYAGMIRSVQEYTRGYFEIRCVCSEGGGFWSAFWLNARGMASAELSDGGLGGAEIDIFESNNYGGNLLNRNSVTHAVHVGGYGDGLRSENEGSFKVPNPYTQFNTYGLEWNEKEYIFYINGVESVRTSWQKGVSRAPEYIIISEELPNLFTEQPGFTTEFVVDYVRVYQMP
ncbi:MAG TPA: glycoside hydrolase family 16 protein [Clostridiales bacterium]|nr:MAG: Beta-glucanase precursor [Firmicutes bacterium ADurb.Bin262]HOU09889.1 glycoside hydrolase family 16 protein [Clostridiales bacterium]HQH62342.1 glycoside hydrolase family 16 protein [Clostridiales bacterium]HQK72757.1 glycoside hydrolase family 16 protein [Clostridiales bacterium]